MGQCTRVGFGDHTIDVRFQRANVHGGEAPGMSIIVDYGGIG